MGYTQKNIQHFYEPTEMRVQIFALAIMLTSAHCFILSRKNLGVSSVPIDIDVCEETPDSVLQSFQATWEEAPKPGMQIKCNLSAQAIADIDIEIVQVQTKSAAGAVLQTDNLPAKQKVNAGDNFDWSYGQYLPSFTPHGEYNLTIHFLDAAGNSNACARVPLQL